MTFNPHGEAQPKYVEVNGKVVQSRQNVACPGCRAPLMLVERDKWLGSAVTATAFVFTCGSIYDSRGGLGALRMSQLCRDRRQATQRLPTSGMNGLRRW